MTDYYAKSYVPVVPGDLHDFRGEIRLEDAYVVSQDVSVLQPHVVTYLTDAETPPRDVLEGGLSWTGVMEAVGKGPQSHAEGRNHDGRVPVRYVVLVFLGLVLTGLALVGFWLAPVILEVVKR